MKFKFKAVYDEATVPTRIRRKASPSEVATVLAKFGDDKVWVLDPASPNDPYTVSMEYWEPVPELTPSDALPGDLWSYGDWGFAAKYRVLGVDTKRGVWHIVTEEFDYKSNTDFAVQYENDEVTVYTRTLPDEGTGGRTIWKLVERP